MASSDPIMAMCDWLHNSFMRLTTGNWSNESRDHGPEDLEGIKGEPFVTQGGMI